MRIIPALDVGLGNCIWNVPLDAVLSPPNASTQTASVVLELEPVVVLYISAPFAVNDALV